MKRIVRIPRDLYWMPPKNCKECGAEFRRMHNAEFCWPCIKARGRKNVKFQLITNQHGVRVLKKSPYPCALCGGCIMERGISARYCLECSASGGILQKLKQKAQMAIDLAIKLGELNHPTKEKCADCGAPAFGYDHRDYNKPLEVDPICRSCNWHRGPSKTKYPDAFKRDGTLRQART